MSITVHVANSEDWRRSDRTSVRRYGVGIGRLFKELRAVQTMAFEGDNLENTDASLVSSLPRATCTPDAVHVTTTPVIRKLNGDPDHRTSTDDPAPAAGPRYERKSLSSQAVPLWSGVARASVLQPPDASVRTDTPKAAPVLEVAYTNHTKRHVTMRPYSGHSNGEGRAPHRLLDINTLKAGEALTDTTVLLSHHDVASATTYVVENRKPFDRDTVFRVKDTQKRGDVGVCYANGTARANKHRCPVPVPFLPTCRVPLINLMREGLVFDIKTTRGDLHAVRVELDEEGWWTLTCIEGLLPPHARNLAHPRALSVHHLATEPASPRRVALADVVRARGPRMDMRGLFSQTGAGCDTGLWRSVLRERDLAERGVAVFRARDVGAEVSFALDPVTGAHDITIRHHGSVRREVARLAVAALRDGEVVHVHRVDDTEQQIWFIPASNEPPFVAPNPARLPRKSTFLFTTAGLAREMVSYSTFVRCATRVTGVSSKLCCRVGVVTTPEGQSRVVPLEHSDVPFYMWMERGFGDDVTKEFFCNLAFCDNEAVTAHVRAHDAPYCVTASPPPTFDPQRHGDSFAASWVSLNADATLCADDGDDDAPEAWQTSSLSSRRVDHAIVTLQAHLDATTSYGRFLVYRNDEWRHLRARQQTHCKLQGLVCALPLQTVLLPDGRFRLTVCGNSADAQPKWDDPRHFRPCDQIADAVEVDEDGGCETPLQLHPFRTVVKRGDTFLLYAPLAAPFANVDVFLAHDNLANGNAAPPSAVARTTSQRILLNLKCSFAVAWSARATTIFEFALHRCSDQVREQEAILATRLAGEQRQAEYSTTEKEDLSKLTAVLGSDLTCAGRLARSFALQRTRAPSGPLRGALAMRVASDVAECSWQEGAASLRCCALAATGEVGAQPSSVSLGTLVHSYCPASDDTRYRVHVLAGSVDSPGIGAAIVEDQVARKWRLHDTLAGALAQTGIDRTELDVCPDPLTSLQTRSVRDEGGGRVNVFANHNFCVDIAFVISNSAAVVLRNTDDDIGRHMRRLSAIEADSRSNECATINWWTDLMVLLALRPDAVQVRLAIAPAVATPAFLESAVRAVAMFEDMARDAARGHQGTAASAVVRWQRSESAPTTHGPEGVDGERLRALIRDAWAASDPDATVLALRASDIPPGAPHCVEVTSPHRPTEIVTFSPVRGGVLRESEMTLLRAIFRGRARPMFRDPRLERRVEALIRRRGSG
jgi:hypothetical protein